MAAGGDLGHVLRDLILLTEKPSNGEMLGSVLFISEDGKHLLEGAAQSLPSAYNAAIHGIAIGYGVGSCGTAAFTGEPIYVSDIANDPLWKDFRDLALSHGLRACWSVPIRAADGQLLGTFANYYREPRVPTERDTETIAMVAQTTALAIERHQHERERERAEEQRSLLVRELNHRVKNFFALADGIVRMSARSADTVPGAIKVISGRLSSLHRAHDLILTGVSMDAAPLKAVLHDIAVAYSDENGMRVHLHGPALKISGSAVAGIALTFHELATNAAKYGALAGIEGKVDVTWQIEGGRLNLEWREGGGPEVSQPQRKGFGTMLSRSTIEGQFGGIIDYDWNVAGLRVSISIPLSSIVPKADT